MPHAGEGPQPCVELPFLGRSEAQCAWSLEKETVPLDKSNLVAPLLRALPIRADNDLSEIRVPESPVCLLIIVLLIE